MEFGWFPFVLFSFGLLIGSFLNVVGYRLPRMESVVFPASRCPGCKTRLQYFEMIPVLSWLFLKGSCRTCSIVIPIRYPIVEMVTGVLFALTAMQGYSESKLLAWCVFWIVLVAALSSDMASMRIPNVITFIGGALVLFAAMLAHIQSFQSLFFGGFVCFLALGLVHVLSGGRMGLGDAKLYFSIGVMLGPGYGLLSFAFASAFGSCVGLLLRAFSLVSKKEAIPFVPYIFMGVVVTAFFGPSFIGWYTSFVI